MVSKVVGYRGGIKWDVSKPNGAPRKLMSNSKLKELGWTPKMELDEGVQKTFDWYAENMRTIRGE